MPYPKLMVPVGWKDTDAVGYEESEEYMLFSLRHVTQFCRFPSVVSFVKNHTNQVDSVAFCGFFLEFITG